MYTPKHSDIMGCHDLSQKFSKDKRTDGDMKAGCCLPSCTMGLAEGRCDILLWIAGLWLYRGREFSREAGTWVARVRLTSKNSPGTPTACGPRASRCTPSTTLLPSGPMIRSLACNTDIPRTLRPLIDVRTSPRCNALLAAAAHP